MGLLKVAMDRLLETNPAEWLGYQMTEPQDPTPETIGKAMEMVKVKAKMAMDSATKQLQQRLATEQEKCMWLQEFARHVIRQECWSIFEQDGGDIQEWAEKLGLIVPHVATEEDVGDEGDYEVGEMIFKFSETLKDNAGI